MSSLPQEVYHCPSCGALAQAGAGGKGERVCAECGYEFRAQVRISPRSVAQQSVSRGGFVQRDVSARRRQNERVEPVLQVDTFSAEAAAEETGQGGRGTKEEVISDDGNKKIVRRFKKRRRTRLTPLLFLCGWTIVVMLVVIVVRRKGGGSGAEEVDARQKEEQRLKARELQVAAYLDKNHASCRAVFEEFLAAGTATGRTQYVRDSNRLASLMADYYRNTLPWSLPEGGRLVTRDANLFMRGENRAIELLMGIEGTEGKHPDKEVAFVNQGSRWVLEWEAFVNHSTDPWQLFIKGAGRSEGVFRVYMRQSPVSHETARPEIKVQFMQPQDDELMWQQKSDWVVVPLNSENGRRIEYIMAQAGRERELGDSMFGAKDPPGLYRARVLLAWETPASGPAFLTLRDVQAGNWYGPGFEEQFAAAPTPAAGPGTEQPEPETGDEEAADPGADR